MIGIVEEDRCKAFRIALRDNALDQYRAILKENKDSNLEILRLSIKYTFEGQEHQQMLLAKWNKISLQSVLNEQEGIKDIERALITLITNLQKIQSGLDQSFKNEPFLHSKLLTTCRGNPATRAACSTYSNNNSVTDLSYRLQASQQNRHINHSYKETSRKNTSNEVQRCFVCRKERCWSTRHTEQERQQARKQFQTAYLSRKNNQQSGTYLSDIEFEEKLEAFVVECEGQDPNNLDTELELIDHFDHFSLEDNESETFLTTCGKMTESDAFKTAHQLSQQSTKHAITRTVTQFKLEADNRISTLESRYDLSKIYGIIIDTGAAGYFTAGYKYAITSMGSITIPTTIEPCFFHLVQTNTPFLLSLNDLDEKRALFDNLQNKIRLNNGPKIPIVRLFGHAFLQWSPTVTIFSYLSEPELRTLHRRFGHSSVQRLIKISHRAGHNEPEHQRLLA
ncbi:hypothetical protein GcM1_243068 [Golovinomyces cichoracearum]|uniref:GAG-pre-integrase domain-containing protein n=1 Tax=Golovinomyces cichoracearum TaxID=62708 RepID=A0A420IGF3_9PEZI|nr:hypothetical protein GcM1_243068 [Golovinomyces cichoracearum]